MSSLNCSCRRRPPTAAAARRFGARRPSAWLQPAYAAGVTSGSGATPLAHEMVGFALSLLLGALRKGRFDTRRAADCALLEPLLPLLQRAMRLDSDTVVSLALRTLCSLLAFPLPSLPAHASALLERTMKLLRRAAAFASATDLVANGLKAVTTLFAAHLAADPDADGGSDDDDEEDKGEAAAREGRGRRRRARRRRARVASVVRERPPAGAGAAGGALRPPSRRLRAA